MNDHRWNRKTVVIGLGGTGRDVVLNVKRKYREVYGSEDVPATRFLVFDTADAKPLILPGGDQIELSPGEFCKMAVNSPALAKEVNEEINGWFPQEPIPMMSIHRGASQIRALGRMALYSNARDVYARIKRAIDGVNSILPHADLGRFRITGDSVLVNVVSSLSGGTGSGTLLDVAYVCREHMRSATDTLTAYLLLPDVFTTLTATDNVEANAYAALSELDYLAQEARFDRPDRSFLFGGREISMRQRPFDTTYLVNNRNQRGQVYETVPELTELIGLGIFVATGAPGKEALDVWDNLQHQIGQKIQGKEPFYASFGVSELALDLAGHADREARRLAVDTLTLTFLGEAHSGTDDADHFLRVNEVGGDLPKRLLNGALAQLNGSNVLPEKLGEFVNSGWQKALSSVEIVARENPVPEHLESDLQTSLSTAVASLLAKNSGVPCAHEFLKALTARLNVQIETLDKEIQEHKQKIEQARRNAEGQQARAEQARQAWWWRRKAACATVAKQFAAAVNSGAANLFELKGKERAHQVLSGVRKASRDQQEVFEALRDLALRATRWLAPEEAAERAPEPFTIRIACPQPKHSHVSLEPGSFVAWLATRKHTVSELALFSAAQFSSLLLEFANAQPGVREMAGATVVEALAALDESEQRKTLQNLDSLASPLWEYEPGYLPAGRRTQTIQILGIPDADTDLDKLLPTLQTGRTAQQVMTNDAHRIYCYKVEAAIPAFMLAGARRYKTRFDALRDSMSFHTGREFENAPEIMPDDLHPSATLRMGSIPVKDVRPERSNGGSPREQAESAANEPKARVPGGDTPALKEPDDREEPESV